jgi:hypothetical protein
MSKTDQNWKDLQVAQWIADYLFVNGQGQEADRLVLTTKEGKDLGGWCKRAVVDRIVDNLRESRDSTPAAPVETETGEKR